MAILKAANNSSHGIGAEGGIHGKLIATISQKETMHGFRSGGVCHGFVVTYGSSIFALIQKSYKDNYVIYGSGRRSSLTAVCQGFLGGDQLLPVGGVGEKILRYSQSFWIN